MKHQNTNEILRVQAPNKETAKAIAELEAGHGQKATGVQALMESMNAAKPAFTTDELYEVNDSLNRYVEHMIEVGQTETEIKYNSLANTWSAHKKVAECMFSGDLPDWVQTREAQVQEAIQKPKLISESQSKRLQP